jgi:heme A synthase
MQASETSSGRFARYAWAVTALNVAVVLEGALVRATGSGAGCGNNWPRCNGEVIPTSPTIHTLIEFTHRAMTSADVPMVGFLVFLAFRLFPKHHPVRVTAVLSAIFLVSEALIGAGLVLFDQVAQNASPSRAWWLSGHFLNTLTLLALPALTAWWATQSRPLRFTSEGAITAGVSLAAVALLGISGVIAALGDTLYPSASLATGLAQDFSPDANFWMRLRLFHPMIAVGVGVWLAYYALSAMTRRLELRPRALVLLGFVAAQVAAGAANLFLLAPLWMQILHLLLADMVWIALVILCAETLSTPVASRASGAWLPADAHPTPAQR